MTIFIILIIYVISVILCFSWVRKVYYHEKGIFNYQYPEGHDYFLTFFPFVNTLAAFSFWFFFWPIKKDKKYKDDNIFNPNRGKK